MKKFRGTPLTDALFEELQNFTAFDELSVLTEEQYKYLMERESIKMKKQYISWEKFHSDVITLAKQIKSKTTIEQILTIAKGGIIPASFLAYDLGCLNVSVLWIGSSFMHVFGANTLIVDELADTGETLLTIKNSLLPENTRTATIYKKKHSKFVPDFFVEETPSDVWLVFPWEVK